MDDIKTSIGGWEGREWGGGVSLNLGTLTLYARASPATYIGIDTRQYESGNDELLGCSDSWMRQTVSESNTMRRHASGTRGHCVAVDVSQ